MATREEDIEMVVSKIISMEPISEYYPNHGCMEYSCPFCGSTIEEFQGTPQYISEMKHDNDCIYLVAKDLSTKGKPNE